MIFTLRSCARVLSRCRIQSLLQIGNDVGRCLQADVQAQQGQIALRPITVVSQLAGRYQLNQALKPTPRKADTKQP